MENKNEVFETAQARLRKEDLHKSLDRLVAKRAFVYRLENKCKELRAADVTGKSVRELVMLEVQNALAETKLNAAVQSYAAHLGGFVETYGDEAEAALFGAELPSQPETTGD